MDTFIPRLESQFSELVDKISKLQSLADQPDKFKNLDRELVEHLKVINEHYKLCKIKEDLQNESHKLDEGIDKILLDLAYSRRELISLPTPTLTESRKISSDDLLEYAGRITKFTHQLPGPVEQSILPWPVEDQLRRGMLATYTLQSEQEPLQPEGQDQESQLQSHDANVDSTMDVGSTVDNDSKKDGRADNRKRIPVLDKPVKQKIKLDFDSDEDSE